MTESTKTKWSLEADYLQACNCDYGCPCEFEAPPTMGYCEGVGVWKILKGRYGNVTLDGLGFGFAARWPGPIHKGNGKVQLFFDQKADSQQRDALLQIASGQAGGVPFEIIVATFSTILDPQFVPIEFEIKGKNSGARVGKSVTVAFEPIKNPVTGAEETVRINHETGFLFQSAECVSSKQCEAAVGDWKFSWPGKAGFVTRVKYAN